MGNTEIRIERPCRGEMFEPGHGDLPGKDQGAQCVGQRNSKRKDGGDKRTPIG